MKAGLVGGALVGAMCVGVAQAEPVGAPASDAKKGSFGFGLDYTRTDFKLKRQEGIGNPDWDYEVTEMKGTGLRASYALVDGIRISGGAGNLKGGKTKGANFNGPTGITGENADGRFWFVGGDAILWQSGPLAVGLAGRYTDYDWQTSEVRGSNPGTDHVSLNATQGSLGVGYTFMSSLTPYGGVAVERLSGDTLFVQSSGSIRREARLKNNGTYGYVGVRYQTPWKVAVGIEAQTNSSWSANLGINF